jgi:hypothetical protein
MHLLHIIGASSHQSHVLHAMLYHVHAKESLFRIEVTCIRKEKEEEVIDNLAPFSVFTADETTVLVIFLMR